MVTYREDGVQPAPLKMAFTLFDYKQLLSPSLKQCVTLDTSRHFLNLVPSFVQQGSFPSRFRSRGDLLNEFTSIRAPSEALDTLHILVFWYIPAVSQQVLRAFSSPGRTPPSRTTPTTQGSFAPSPRAPRHTSVVSPTHVIVEKLAAQAKALLRKRLTHFRPWQWVTRKRRLSHAQDSAGCGCLAR